MITILPMHIASVYTPKTENAVLIRVLDPGEKGDAIENPDQYKAIHRISVHDNAGFIGRPPGWKNAVLFDEGMASDLVDFVNQYPNTEEWVVHCHAGVSRSAAVGLSIAWITEDREAEKAILQNTTLFPNPHILTVMAHKLSLLPMKQETINMFVLGSDAPIIEGPVSLGELLKED
ncbi:hypothetical protein IMZ31_21955 (plasmid) [Pontibacillus sp. ALD_SL1]|uniref:hypothetical protein n=1 Tax=Pontibacillus sp. ALD_SL1 TaxID=2777185 RepID=UPI001A97885D|nr:hypothetical protein [Pontibacillus sp. ALD_SL1]QST02118.1 hypothetical protein IMZ31_21955 [Pontibacillus sp. ALD_SL1]